MKRVNTKVSKKVAAIILAAFAACSVMGCSVEKNFTSTTTHTVTDANGNTTTTTRTNNNGKVTEETVTYTAEEAMAAMEEKAEVQEINEVASYEKVPLALTNEMGWDIAQLYIKMSDQDEWSDNFLSENQYIDDGVTANGITVNYTEEQRFMDIRVADSTGDGEEFTRLELPEEGADQIEVVFGYDEASNTFTATVEYE